MPSPLAAALADGLESDRRLTLRPSQRPPAGDWTHWLLLAGRGFGKGYAGASWVLENVEAGLGRNIALVGATSGDVRGVMVEGPSGLLELSPAWNRPVFEPSKRRVTWKNGATATLFSSEEPGLAPRNRTGFAVPTMIYAGLMNCVPGKICRARGIC